MISSGLTRKAGGAVGASAASHGAAPALPTARRSAGTRPGGVVVAGAVVLGAVRRLHRRRRCRLVGVAERPRSATAARCRTGDPIVRDPVPTRLAVRTRHVPAGPRPPGARWWRPRPAAAAVAAEGWPAAGRSSDRTSGGSPAWTAPAAGRTPRLGRRRSESEVARRPPQAGATLHAELVLRAHSGSADVALHAVEPMGRRPAPAGTRHTVGDARSIRAVADGSVACRQPAYGADRLAVGPFGGRHIPAAHRGPRSGQLVAGSRGGPTRRPRSLSGSTGTATSGARASASDTTSDALDDVASGRSHLRVLLLRAERSARLPPPRTTTRR